MRILHGAVHDLFRFLEVATGIGGGHLDRLGLLRAGGRSLLLLESLSHDVLVILILTQLKIIFHILNQRLELETFKHWVLFG